MVGRVLRAHGVPVLVRDQVQLHSEEKVGGASPDAEPSSRMALRSPSALTLHTMDCCACAHLHSNTS